MVAKFLEVIEFRSWVESAIPIRESSNNSQGIYGKVLAQFLTIHLKYFIIAAQLGKGSGYELLRLAVRDRKLRAKLGYFLDQISLISNRMNCFAVETA